MAAAPATPRPCVHCSVGSWSSPSVLEAPGWYQCHQEAGREPAQRCAVTWPHSVWRGLKESEEEEARGGHPGPARPLTRPPSLSLPFQAPERTTGADLASSSRRRRVLPAQPPARLHPRPPRAQPCPDDSKSPLRASSSRSAPWDGTARGAVWFRTKAPAGGSA